MGGEESEKVLRRDGMKRVFARTSPDEFAGWGYPLELGCWDTEGSASLAIRPEAPPTTEPEAGSRTQVPGRLVHVLGGSRWRETSHRVLGGHLLWARRV